MIKKKSALKKVNFKAPLRTRKVSHKPRVTQTSSEVKVEKILIENFVSLQKVMTNLSVKFDNLANQISKLLELFEISAKSLAKTDFNLGKETRDDKEIMQKLDSLADQNKTIARGLTLMHEKIPQQESFGFPPESRGPLPPPKKLKPASPGIGKENKQQTVEFGEYQKSISSKPEFE